MKVFSGQRAFLVQRLSALAMLAFLAAAALRLALGETVSIAQWQAWTARPLGATLVLLLSGATLLHAWVGIRDVALDYVKPLALRMTLLAVAVFGLLLLGGWTTLIVLSHAL